LKDLCRDIARAQPTYADVYRDGTAVVEFETHEDMKRAIKDLDDYKFQGRRIYVKEDKGKDRYEPYSRSSRKSKSPRRSKSPSSRRSKSPSERRSKSPTEKRGRSPSPQRGSQSPTSKKSPRSPSPRRGHSPEQNGDKKESRSPSPQ